MEDYAAYPSLELDRPAEHVLRLTLRAAGKLNAVSGDMHRELAAIWKTITLVAPASPASAADSTKASSL